MEAERSKGATVAVFGANGFVGQALCQAALAAGYSVQAFVRSEPTVPDSVEVLRHTDDNRAALEGCDYVFNAIGRAHVLEKEPEVLALERFRAINRDLALAIAEQARDAGAKGLVHISSVAAIRSQSLAGETIDDTTPTAPHQAYGISKLEGDEALLAMSSQDFPICCLRPPVLVGPSAGGLVAKFAKAARKGLPLPLKGIANRRSFMAVDNLADAAIHAMRERAQGAYIVTDSEPMSSAVFYDLLTLAAGKGRRTFAIPAFALKAASKIALGDKVQSLIGDAAYGSARFRGDFHWQPAVTLEDAVKRMMQAERT